MWTTIFSTPFLAAFDDLDPTVVLAAAAVVAAIVLFGIFSMLIKCYKKVEQGTVLIRNGLGGTKVSFSGMLVLPVIHRMELMDISVKRVEIDRMGKNGLICNDNMRADVKVAFFVQVNKTPHDTLKVAQSLGCARASDPQALVEFFDAKFSEALKTVGKQFEFVELYTNRQRFKEEILKVIGTDLNGYLLDDAAIDYLEQTNLENLDKNNILDSDGIKKITDLTAKQAILANAIAREKEKTIKKQDVETREAILVLEKQQAEAEQKQKREVREITAHQEAEAFKVQQEERLKAERSRIATDEEVAIAEENKLRQVIVAQKNKQRTEAVETERLEKERGIEATEKERVVALAAIEKEKAIEVEKRNIQEVIRERVAVERSVVEQEEKIKDAREFATADRAKQVAVTLAEKEGEEEKIKLIKIAEANKASAELEAKEVVIKAEGQRAASEKEADARKIMADASAQEEAIKGMGEARALDAKSESTEKFGTAEATVIERKAVAEARGLEAKALAVEKQGKAEAEVMQQKFHSEAEGIKEKAEAMKLFDGVGREHEEFKLRLNKDLEVALAEINIRQEVAKAQASLVGEALKQANIDIVGGDGSFFDKIVNSVAVGKSVDRTVGSSQVLSDVKSSLLKPGEENLAAELRKLVGQFGLTAGDLKNLTISALLTKVTAMTDDDAVLKSLDRLTGTAKQLGVTGQQAAALLGVTRS